LLAGDDFAVFVDLFPLRVFGEAPAGEQFPPAVARFVGHRQLVGAELDLPGVFRVRFVQHERADVGARGCEGVVGRDAGRPLGPLVLDCSLSAAGAACQRAASRIAGTTGPGRY
jgi:hypothetical protein